jgi:hypothetical protein
MRPQVPGVVGHVCGVHPGGGGGVADEMQVVRSNIMYARTFSWALSGFELHSAGKVWVLVELLVVT